MEFHGKTGPKKWIVSGYRFKGDPQHRSMINFFPFGTFKYKIKIYLMANPEKDQLQVPDERGKKEASSLLHQMIYDIWKNSNPSSRVRKIWYKNRESLCKLVHNGGPRNT